MEKLGRIAFVPLDGDPPVDVTLDALPSASEVADVVRSAFAPFLSEDGDFSIVAGGAPVEPPSAGLLLVYAYGHAWLGSKGPETSTKSGGTTLVEDALQLLDRLVPLSAADRTIVILDCCHAEAFDTFVVPARAPRLLVYASGVDEKAITLLGERASRLSLAVADKLSRRKARVDLVRTIGEVAELLDGDGVIPGQTVGYRMNGRSISLARSAVAGKRRRERTVTLVRNALLAVGGVATAVFGGLAWFYWTHVLVDIDLSGLGGISEEIRIIASEEDPPRNGSSVFLERLITGQRARLWVPASNVIIRIQARYADAAERALAFHLTLQPGFGPSAKSLALALPNAESVLTHPDMAYIPVTRWYRGRERERRESLRPFWIDIRTPTVAEYLDVAKELVRSGRLDPNDSFLLKSRQRRSAIDSLGLNQLRDLNRDLGAIFGAIEAGTSPRVGAPGDIAVGLGEMPCDTCPAPLTRYEAELYCLSRNMRLPTDLEWELAVRGVDGRVYPWGNQFDGGCANVPGLPDKGEDPPGLRPVDAYPNERSPFGLIDTVGNAGDWVANESGPYERVYMGATYRYNPEDATAFRILPVTDSDYLVREITARCVADVVASG